MREGGGEFFVSLDQLAYRSLPSASREARGQTTSQVWRPLTAGHLSGLQSGLLSASVSLGPGVTGSGCLTCPPLGPLSCCRGSSVSTINSWPGGNLSNKSSFKVTFILRVQLGAKTLVTSPTSLTSAHVTAAPRTQET